VHVAYKNESQVKNSHKPRTCTSALRAGIDSLGRAAQHPRTAPDNVADRVLDERGERIHVNARQLGPRGQSAEWCWNS
jgi:hypothetical protein